VKGSSQNSNPKRNGANFTQRRFLRIGGQKKGFESIILLCKHSYMYSIDDCAKKRDELQKKMMTARPRSLLVELFK